jgi:hypothetical protein
MEATRSLVRARRARNQRVFTDNGCETPARGRFHPLVSNDHSLGEMNRSLPSGYQQAETGVP